MLSYRTRN
ncbi:hypothetical protein F383_09005 [Gossypium arboreum]|uniref:Uncharacterized protein n=1 Tax=Gossypium arboreum TaxID=29729 RepID=A0A0B0NKJ6_GOSAR|nr:hypothetical protein F383_09005 [Gossypium arboreum]